MFFLTYKNKNEKNFIIVRDVLNEDLERMCFLGSLHRPDCLCVCDCFNREMRNFDQM